MPEGEATLEYLYSFQPGGKKHIRKGRVSSTTAMLNSVFAGSWCGRQFVREPRLATELRLTMSPDEIEEFIAVRKARPVCSKCIAAAEKAGVVLPS